MYVLLVGTVSVGVGDLLHNKLDLEGPQEMQGAELSLLLSTTHSSV